MHCAFIPLSLKSLPSLPSSRPPKEEAFEDFKVGQGSKINCIFKENKAVLLERHSLLRQLTEEVSAIKREMDCTTASIQQHKELRGGQGTSNGCIIKDKFINGDVAIVTAQSDSRIVRRM